MKRVQLVFTNQTDVWNFLSLNKMPNAEVDEKTVQGFFGENEIEQAQQLFGAKVQDYVATEIQTSAPAPTASKVQTIELHGKSGTTYKGSIYTKGQHDRASLPAHAIVCLSNSSFTNRTWHHAINAIYETANVAQELERFNSRDDISHLIVIAVNPSEQSKVNKTDDLIRSYLHK